MRRFALAGLLCAAWALPAFAQASAPEEKPEDYPAGAGRDETFFSCTACHGFKIVAAQGMTRRQWEDVIELMTGRHGMHPLGDADRRSVLDYLETAFGPRGRAFQNPFLNR